MVKGRPTITRPDNESLVIANIIEDDFRYEDQPYRPSWRSLYGVKVWSGLAIDLIHVDTLLERKRRFHSLCTTFFTTLKVAKN